jgi:hypothetical protein
MTTTVSFNVPSLASVTRADWGFTFHRWAGTIAAVLVVPYAAGLMAGEAWHRLLGWVDAHHMAGLARLGLPGATPSELLISPKLEVVPPLAAVHLISDEAYDALQAFIKEDQADHFLDATKMVVQRLAPAPTPSIAITQPRVGIIHISDPMARAVRMVREGKSQRHAAHVCDVPRSSLQRALKA